MEQKVERKPLLSDDEIARLCLEVGDDQFLWEPGTARAVRRRYEAAIDRGELVIPKTVKPYREGEGWSCTCGFFWRDGGPGPTVRMFCPGCGARIIE